MQDALVDLDGTLDLSFLPEEIAEDQIDLDGLGVGAGGTRKLGYRAIDVSGTE